MGRSILELERSLHNQREDRRRPPRRLAAPAAAPAPKPASQAINRALAARPSAKGIGRGLGVNQRRIAHGLTAIDVAVDGTVGPLRQANAMTCWATVYTMLVNWKYQRSVSVESAIADVGPRWSALLALGHTRGLSASEKVDFLADAGLVALPPQNPMIQTWASKIADYGPIWVTTDEQPPNLFIHARVLLSMRGDGTAVGTMLTLIDPASGTLVTECFQEFLRKFEAEAGNPAGRLRVQIVHWPAGARAFSTARPSGFNVPALLGGTARRALLAALTGGGVSEGQAQGLIAAFEAEVRADSLRPIPLSLRGDAFQSTVPAPGSAGDPHEIAREILSFFYPGRTFSSINDDHVRLAARMFYAALERQRLLNRLPAVPTTPPGPSWLANQAIQILWREIHGVTGFSVMTRNTVALQWRTTLEEIENGLPPTALSLGPTARVLSYVEQQGLGDWITNPDIPLSPAVGGMSLSHDALHIGDIIVSTTSQASSIAIRRIGSPVSHVMLYVGGGQVVEAIGEGVVYRPLSEALAHSYVAVAFRHPTLTNDQALRVRDFVGQRIGASYDYDLIVAHAQFQLGRTVCEQLPGGLRDRCMSAVGPVDIGRGTDGRFICSSLVAEAYAAAGVPLLPIPPRATNPGDIALSANLIYLGHIKYEPPADLAERLRRI